MRPVAFFMTKDFIDKTIKIWQPHFKDPLTEKDALEIINCAYEVFGILKNWANKGEIK